ncbi:MAG TPA: tetratricopeptide repeat protein, partial [Blastocatellia bacterium]
LRSGNFDSPYSYVFEGSVLDTAHYNGLSLELKTILRHFDNGLRNPEKGKESSELNGHRVEQAAKIAIELGRIYKDLSDHNECLNCMDKADKKLDEPSAASIDSATRRELKRRLWHYKAISLSQLGRTEDCLDYYSRVFKDGIVNEEFTWFDALSLGYYAYELKYHDIEEAEKLGEKALQLSRQIGDKNTIIKNLCNLGPTVFFMGKVIESEKFFADAYKESLAQPDASKDKREMGRILINSVVVYIAKKDWAEAEKRIEDCLKLNTEFGDRRRAGSARAYRAILHYKLGDQNRAREVMLDAIGQHLKVESWRELANEVTTYLWMLDPEFKGNLKRIPQARSLPTEVIKCIDHFNEDKALSVFIKFWIERFKPIVLS